MTCERVLLQKENLSKVLDNRNLWSYEKTNVYPRIHLIDSKEKEFFLDFSDFKCF